MMQRHGTRHFISYLITTLLYVGVAVIFFYSKNHQYVSSEIMEEKTIEMSLSTFVPEVVEPPKEIIKEVVEPEPEEEPKEEPKVEEIIEEPLPEPVVEKVVETPIVKKPKPVIKKRIEKPKKKKVVKKKVTKKKKPKKKPSKKQVSSKQSKSTSKEYNKFTSNLQRKINKHIIYPNIAKKRRMEGMVTVKFTILANGNVGKITLSGSKIFYKSIRNAVKKAFPVDVKNAPFSLPEVISLKFTYTLTHN